MLDRAGLLAHGRSVLDVGAGDGWFATRLACEAEGVRITGWDPHYSPESLPRGSERLRFTARAPEERFDLLLVLDVAEQNDRAFLADVVRDLLAPGGHLLFSVPAWPSLFSEHDRFLRHHRRYTPASARALLGAAGLEVLRGAGLFHGLLVPRAVAKAITGRGRSPPEHVGDWKGSGPFTAAVLAALRLGTCDDRHARRLRRRPAPTARGHRAPRRRPGHPGSVTSPGTAKNCITVGASESLLPQSNGRTYGSFWPDDYPVPPFDHDGMANDPEHVAAFSRRGPTQDGRVKPDVVAPGTFILSTRSRKLAANNFAWGAFPQSKLYFLMQVAGRNGMHRYNNMDHSLLTGLLAARNVLGEMHDLWSVSTDEDPRPGGAAAT